MPYAFLIIIGVTSLSLNLVHVSNAYDKYALIKSASFHKVFIIIIIVITIHDNCT
jgi:hypothetical protein